MEINDLRAILTLAEKRNYAATADALFISTSALSRHVAALEKQLGVPLFCRNSRRVSVTRYGELILPYARQIAQMEEACLEELERAKRSDHAGLCIGACEELYAREITPRIAQFLAEYPGTSLELCYEANDALIDGLQMGKYHFVLVQEEGPSADDALGRMTVAVDVLAAALPCDHLLAGAESVRLSQLRGESFLPSPPQSFCSHLAAGAFRRAGFTPKQTRLEVSGVNRLDLVEQELGIALVREKQARSMARPGVALVPLDPPERIWVNLVWPAEGLMEIGKMFLSCFRGGPAGKASPD